MVYKQSMMVAVMVVMSMIVVGSAASNNNLCMTMNQGIAQETWMSGIGTKDSVIMSAAFAATGTGQYYVATMSNPALGGGNYFEHGVLLPNTPSDTYGPTQHCVGKVALSGTYDNGATWQSFNGTVYWNTVAGNRVVYNPLSFSPQSFWSTEKVGGGEACLVLRDAVIQGFKSINKSITLPESLCA